jgi:hypothetical protein
MMLTRSAHKYNTRLATRTIQRVNYANMFNNRLQDKKNDPDYEPYVYKERIHEDKERIHEDKERILEDKERILEDKDKDRLPIFTVMGFKECKEPIEKTKMEFNWIGDALMYGEILTELGKMDKSYYKYHVKYNDSVRQKLCSIFSEIHRETLQGILFHYHRTRVASYGIWEIGVGGAAYNCPKLRKRLMEKHRIYIPINL